MRVALVSQTLPGGRAIGIEALQEALRAEPGRTDAHIMLALLIEDAQPSRAQSLLDQARESWRREKHTLTFDEYLTAQRHGPGAPRT